MLRKWNIQIREWLICVFITAALLLVASYPICATRWPEDDEDLRQKVQILEKRVERLHELLTYLEAKQKIDNISPDQSEEIDKFPDDYLRERYNQLTQRLRLSAKQKQKLHSLLGDYKEKNIGQRENVVWHILEIRERIQKILTPQQNEMYSRMLLTERRGF